MCGIFGHIGKKKFFLKSCTDIISHRGPDSQGFLWYDPSTGLLEKSEEVSWNVDNKFKVSFGFRRLAIIDLVPESNQPMFSHDGKYAIIYNGEIYNYLEIRKELETKGMMFKTSSDTEVILESYRFFGLDCVNKFNGMWAFSILDFEKNILFCSRDRFGIKPFYYSRQKDDLIFASEIKQFWGAGVEREINQDVIKDFLSKSVINHTEETFYKGINQLKAGHNLVVSFTNSEITNINISKYWELGFNPHYESLKFPEATEKFLDFFRNSVHLRYRSDVLVGVCLSGGLDSSSIASLACTERHEPIYTFSSIFENSKKYDERNYIEMVIEKYPSIRPYFTTTVPSQIITDIDEILWHQDEPFGTFSILAQWNVMKLARENGVTVLLDGQGADEFLAGYRKYYAFYLKDCLKKFKLRRFVTGLFFLVKYKEFDFFNNEGLKRYLRTNNVASFLSDKSSKLKTSAKIGLRSVSSLKEKFFDDVVKFSIPQLLRYEDRNSMAFSIESRVPFLDFELATFMYSLNPDFLFFKGYTKYILREALGSFLPKKIRQRINKLGFVTPQPEWMASPEIKNYFREYFFNMQNPYLNNRNIYEDFLSYPNSELHSYDFSRFYIFDRWYQINFVDPNFINEKFNSNSETLDSKSPVG